MKSYIISIDQSTQGTKALLFDKDGQLLHRADLPHEQIINEKGWVSHNPMEIYKNTVSVVKAVIELALIDKESVAAIGISNQRETSLAWNKSTGKPIDNAIVWQCSRAKEICKSLEDTGKGELVRSKTGIPLSPYYPASKIAWLLANVPGAKELSKTGNLCYGTMDSWLVFNLTNKKSYKTDYSNASRTQLFNVTTLSWDKEVCEIFGIDHQNLAEVCDSNSLFGETDLDGYFEIPIPIYSVLGDSHGALFGQGCLLRGMTKTTYGTGSSIMMNVGEKPVFSKNGVVTSLAWGMNGKVNYVLEGNINYTGAVIRWLQKDLKMIQTAKEAEELAMGANPADKTYLVPAFTGLGAPYWDSKATGIISGITRTTGRAEICKAALDCIAYQITDIVKAMSQDSGILIEEMRVDGGPTRNAYLMQFQSDMLGFAVQVPDAEELSGIGAAYAAGMAAGLYNTEIFEKMGRVKFSPKMKKQEQTEKYDGWKHAVGLIISK